MPIASARSRERVARNFIKSYGRTRFRRLLEALARSESGQALADEFSVSRERIRQWKNTFGTVITVYQVHPEVDRLLRERKPPVQQTA
jgi:IS1 family transposase